MEENKEKINILANIENYNGSHTGRLGPVILTVVLISAPPLFYFLLLARYIPFKLALIVWAFWSIRVLMIIPGKEKQKKEEYRKSLHDVYATADDLIREAGVQEDGLIEYENGMVAYILSGCPMTYINDDALSIDLENFLHQLRDYEWDSTCQLVEDEFKLQRDMSKMKVYVDREMMKERMDFYIDQDQECHDKVTLFRFNFIVKTSRYNWKTMKSHLTSLVNSDAAKVFKYLCICDKRLVEDISSRDLCFDFNLERMLTNKYKNDDFNGSKVIYYGEQIPENLQQKKEEVGLNRRRVQYKE